MMRKTKKMLCGHDKHSHITWLPTNLDQSLCCSQIESYGSQPAVRCTVKALSDLAGWIVTISQADQN